jgi:hypothetical protein
MEMDSDASSDLEMPVRPSKTTREDSDMEDGDSGDENPYPYEGLYKDEADKERCVLPTFYCNSHRFPIPCLSNSLQQLSVVEREKIIGERQDEIAKIREARDLANMAAASTSAAMSRMESERRESSGRTKTATGTSSTKTQLLQDLKKKRSAKQNKSEKVLTDFLSLWRASTVPELGCLFRRAGEKRSPRRNRPSRSFQAPNPKRESCRFGTSTAQISGRRRRRSWRRSKRSRASGSSGGVVPNIG